MFFLSFTPFGKRAGKILTVDQFLNSSLIQAGRREAHQNEAHILP